MSNGQGTPGEPGQGTPGAEPGGSGGSPAKPWYDGKLDSDLIGHMQNMGLADKTPDEVAVAVVKAHREAQKMIGVPADRLLKLPAKSDDIEGWNAVYQKLGAAAKAEDYNFDGVKFGDGSDLAPKFQDLARGLATKFHLSVEGGKELASDLVKYMDAATTEETAEKTATLNAQKEVLARNWGQNFNANHFIASEAAKRLGFTAEEVASLEGLVGYDRIMEAFRVVGAQMGEGIFVQGSGNSSGGIMTRDQAVARINELKADRAWSERYLNGGAQEKREMQSLHVIAFGRAA